MKNIRKGYVGIDSSLASSGFSVFNGKGELVDAFTVATNKKDGSIEVRVEEIFNVTTWVTANLDTRLVALEDFAFSRGKAAHALGAVGGVIRLALVMNKVPFITIPPNTLKKFVLGKGTGDKTAMAVGVLKKWGKQFPNSDEVDAYALGRMARAWSLFHRAKYGDDTAKKLFNKIGLSVLQRDSLKACVPCSALARRR